MSKIKNPIPSNTHKMTTIQLLVCARVLSCLFDMVNENCKPDEIASFLDRQREILIEQWK